MLTKSFDRNKQYCLTCNTKNKLSHAWNCMSDFDDDAWNDIDNACFFDIKLYPNIHVNEYKTIIEKIKQISHNKFIWLHCSNISTNTLDDDTVKLYWKIVELFHSNTDFGIEFEHKLTRRDRQEFNTRFFKDIMNFAKDNDLTWAKIYQLDKDETTEHMFFHKNDKIILDNSQQ